MSFPARLTVDQALRIAEDEVNACHGRKPPRPTVSARSSLVRADAYVVDDAMVRRAADAFTKRGAGDWKWEDGMRLALHAALDSDGRP